VAKLARTSAAWGITAIAEESIRRSVPAI